MFTRMSRTFDGIKYAPGRKFRVTRPGMRLSGWGPSVRGCSTGWSQPLEVGDIIECTGYGEGWGSDPGYGIEWTSEKARAEYASHCDLWPQAGGVFDFRPVPGSVEPVDHLPRRQRDDAWRGEA